MPGPCQVHQSGAQFSVLKQQRVATGARDEDRVPSLKSHLMGQVAWKIWVDLDMRVPEEGFKVASIFTTLLHYLPVEELRFNITRLRELEERAKRAIPSTTKAFTNEYLAGLCKRQLRYYNEYIPQNQSDSAKVEVESQGRAITLQLVMWLLTGHSNAFPDNLEPIGEPYTVLTYNEYKHMSMDSRSDLTVIQGSMMADDAMLHSRCEGTQNAPAAAAAARPTTGQPEQNYWDSTPDGERVHCALGFDQESDSPSARGLNYVARSRSSPQFGYLLEVSVWPGLKHRFKGEFSIEERSAAAEEKLEGERVHNLKGHLMGELPVLSPWERLMLNSLDRGCDRDKLPFPCPPSAERKRRVQSRNICRAKETRNVISSNPDVSTEVGWTLWLELDVPVPSEGFRISSLFTSLWNYTPEVEIKFNMDRLRELENGAERARLESDQTDSIYMMQTCKQQLRNYMEYIRKREGRPTEAGPPEETPSRQNGWVTSDDLARETLMWLLTGVSTALPDNMTTSGGPYKTISYERSMSVEGTPVGKVLTRVLE
ncbi:hypothetical protein FOZ63_016966 [Perkinsus olseni]|uniref:Uncharacterized protein n=2 Tax=Perkinsus olseni TaxID=32597 RepID=A0A7J6QJL1_PEROL|nr:hypothetical protein FOZ63_016966 [Perkinsus olseni]